MICGDLLVEQIDTAGMVPGYKSLVRVRPTEYARLVPTDRLGVSNRPDELATGPRLRRWHILPDIADLAERL